MKLFRTFLKKYQNKSNKELEGMDILDLKKEIAIMNGMIVSEEVARKYLTQT